MARTKNAALKLGAVVGLPVLVLFDDDERDGLNLLIGGETLAAIIADTAPPDGIVILSRS